MSEMRTVVANIGFLYIDKFDLGKKMLLNIWS